MADDHKISNERLNARNVWTIYCSVQKSRLSTTHFGFVRQEDVVDVGESANLQPRKDFERLVKNIAPDPYDVAGVDKKDVVFAK